MLQSPKYSENIQNVPKSYEKSWIYSLDTDFYLCQQLSTYQGYSLNVCLNLWNIEGISKNYRNLMENLEFTLYILTFTYVCNWVRMWGYSLNVCYNLRNIEKKSKMYRNLMKNIEFTFYILTFTYINNWDHMWGYNWNVSYSHWNIWKISKKYRNLMKNLELDFI